MLRALDKFISQSNGKKITFEIFVDLFYAKSSLDSKESIKDLFDSFADEKIQILYILNR